MNNFCDLCLRDIVNHGFIIPFLFFTINFKLPYDWHNHNKLLSISDNSPYFLIHGVSFVVARHNTSFTTTTTASTSVETTTLTNVTIDWNTQCWYKENEGVGGKDEMIPLEL